MVTDREWPDVGGGHGSRGLRVRTSVQADEMIVEVVGELDLATASGGADLRWGAGRLGCL